MDLRMKLWGGGGDLVHGPSKEIVMSKNARRQEKLERRTEQGKKGSQKMLDQEIFTELWPTRAN
jgi:hypothetical protein